MGLNKERRKSFAVKMLNMHVELKTIGFFDHPDNEWKFAKNYVYTLRWI